VIALSDGRIAGIRCNEKRLEPRELDW
jgi:hypothetical protein